MAGAPLTAAASLGKVSGLTAAAGLLVSLRRHRHGTAAVAPRRETAANLVRLGSRLTFADYGTPLLERVPGAELVMLPGVGHVPMSDDPALVANTILEVTAAVAAPATTEARA
jgi:pimeloyl-ACP methyl ester carboxylesterase